MYVLIVGPSQTTGDGGTGSMLHQCWDSTATEWHKATRTTGAGDEGHWNKVCVCVLLPDIGQALKHLCL